MATSTPIRRRPVLSPVAHATQAPQATAQARRAPIARPLVRRPPPRAANAPTADLSARFQIEYIPVTDITPYPFNPRDNEKAIPAVAESIRAFGFLIPCVVDENNVLVAGHTRTEAAKLLSMDDIPCIRAAHLTQDQINAFRLIDNKVAEQAMWDFDLLSGEIGKLTDLGLDFTKFGWKQEEIDCLHEVVADSCLTSANDVPAEAEAAVSQRRAPITARMVLGEVVFFIPATAYRNWVDGLRALHDFSEEAIVNDIKGRLGILE